MKGIRLRPPTFMREMEGQEVQTCTVAKHYIPFRSGKYGDRNVGSLDRDF